ncbi:myo-inositol 2-dehydrogenase [Salinisphaera hydrothermalis C41B8]|uniref:Myo-inositol 2-dehydrogenase n=3 Tax=Salinisphaera TaxID=180541 RepID=A0A084IMI9_SALHC|nr:inositol 2-dehydrogenase [Salinisphaera hydrothermalis]KEZ77923.1 myo-inositol 2-dehydrogenase [Salinisphaera hydrothermalis C41B8]
MSEPIMNLAIIGAGRIAHVHAAAAARDPRIALKYVSDIRAEAAEALASMHGAASVDVDTIFADDAIDAVLIASSTATHAEFLERAATTGKAVLCEKPIALDIERTKAAVDVVNAHPVACALGFNRRHDPQFAALKAAIEAGRIGQLETLTIISRDPAPPPIDYIKGSGGLFFDMMIHDFDVARWLLDEPIASVFASGGVMVDPAIGEAGDIDTAMVVLTTESGRLCHIQNSRRTAYGYDQRIEAFGSAGMLQAVNETETRLRYTGEAGQLDEPPKHFFLERYGIAYGRELGDLYDAWSTGSAPKATHEDGYQSLRLAAAATQSLAENRSVRLDEIG